MARMLWVLQIVREVARGPEEVHSHTKSRIRTRYTDGPTVSRQMAERKRRCKREDESDTDTDDASDKPFWDDEEFLAATMNQLIKRTSENIMDHLGGEKDPDAFANLLHDELVYVWEGPLADGGPMREHLKRKRVLWAERNKSPDSRHSSPELGEPRPKGRTEPNDKSNVPVSR